MANSSLLSATGVAKNYGAVAALRNASLEVASGEVIALMGANGAGKSTLVKILTGAISASAGDILIRGERRPIRSPADARRAGLVPVYQEPSLIPDLDVYDNLRLGNTPVEPFRDWLHQLGIDNLDFSETAQRLPLAIKQKQLDRSVIYISHRFAEIAAVCDRANVLRDGETVGDVVIEPGIEDHIVELMLGESMRAVRKSVSTKKTTVAATTSTSVPRLKVQNLAAGSKLTDVSFELHAGEVLGIAALEGQGQDELFEVLAGMMHPDSGTIEIDGKKQEFHHPADAISAGHVYVPGDRADALLMQRSVRENIAIPFHTRPSQWGLINMAAEQQKVDAAIKRLQIDTRAQGEVQRLSGGNQQKVTIARWLALGVKTLLCFDPTRGIDIRTKREIYPLLRELADQGSSVLLYTSELEEIQLACDRAVVIFGGRVVDEISAENADEPTLMRAAYGLTDGSASQAQHAGL